MQLAHSSVIGSLRATIAVVVAAMGVACADRVLAPVVDGDATSMRSLRVMSAEDRSALRASLEDARNRLLPGLTRDDDVTRLDRELGEIVDAITALDDARFQSAHHFALATYASHASHAPTDAADLDAISHTLEHMTWQLSAPDQVQPWTRK